MIDISVYLSGYKQAFEKKVQEKQTLAEIIKQVTGIEISPDLVIVSKNKVTINVTGSKKAVVFLKRGKLQKELTAYFASFTDVK